MKVLFVNSLFPTADDRRAIGGAEIFSLRLVRGLLEHGHEVSIVRTGTTPDGGVERTEGGVEVHSLPQRNIYPFSDGLSHGTPNRLVWHVLEDRMRMPPALDRILASVRPDLVHTNNVAGMTTDIWRVVHEAGIPLLHTLHDYYLTCPKVLRYARGHPCVQTCASCAILSRHRRQAVRYVDKVVGVSQRMLDIHRAEGLFADTTAEVILNKSPPRRTTMPRPLGLRPVFGYIGRQAPEKGIYELLQAFATLEPGAASLTIAGTIEPTVRDWVARHVPRPDDVGFTGFTSHDGFYPTIDVAVFPSIWEEPCSMGAGEAFAFGVPAIGSRRGGLPEMLEDGRFGWLFEPGTGELARLMTHLVANPADIAGKADIVRTAAAAADTQDGLVAAYLRTYADLIRRNEPVGVPA